MSQNLKPRTLAAVVAFCLLGAVLMIGRLTIGDPDDRVITLATAWGDGPSIEASSAAVRWSVTSGEGGGKIIPKQVGHFETVIIAKKGDHITLDVTPSNAAPASCSITGQGLAVHGGNHCEVLRLA